MYYLLFGFLLAYTLVPLQKLHPDTVKGIVIDATAAKPLRIRIEHIFPEL